MNTTEYVENEWITEQYCTVKVCVGGLIVASIAYAMTGKSGYTLTINNFTFKKHFDTIDDAKILADNFISKRVDKYLQTKNEKNETRGIRDYCLL